MVQIKTEKVDSFDDDEDDDADADSSVSKKVARKTWARLWLLRRQEKWSFYTIFRELSVEDSDGFCEYMRTPYAKFELINFYTFSRRHVEF